MKLPSEELELIFRALADFVPGKFAGYVLQKISSQAALVSRPLGKIKPQRVDFFRGETFFLLKRFE
jgi:hypothetical protein